MISLRPRLLALGYRDWARSDHLSVQLVYRTIFIIIIIIIIIVIIS